MMHIDRRQALVMAGGAALVPLVASSPAAYASEANEWAEIAARHFASLGVMPVRNDDDDGTGWSLKHGLIQRHVDWFSPIIYGKPQKTDPRTIDRALYALAANVAKLIGAASELKTFALKMPNKQTAGKDIYSAASLSFGYLRLRALQSYVVFWDDDGVASEEGMVNRIDILFPWTGA